MQRVGEPFPTTASVLVLCPGILIYLLQNLAAWACCKQRSAVSHPKLWHRVSDTFIFPTASLLLLKTSSSFLRSLCSGWKGKAKLGNKLLQSKLTIGEGNGTPLQYSRLENPMDRGAWWAAVHGVPQSRTRLKRLSSSSSSELAINATGVTFITYHHVTGYHKVSSLRQHT